MITCQSKFSAAQGLGLCHAKQVHHLTSRMHAIYRRGLNFSIPHNFSIICGIPQHGVKHENNRLQRPTYLFQPAYQISIYLSLSMCIPNNDDVPSHTSKWSSFFFARYHHSKPSFTGRMEEARWGTGVALWNKIVIFLYFIRRPIYMKMRGWRAWSRDDKLHSVPLKIECLHDGRVDGALSTQHRPCQTPAQTNWSQSITARLD